jgi:hypothetical protein
MTAKWDPAPPDPGFKPGGLRERAWRAMAECGPRPEDPEKTKRSQEHWAKFRANATENTSPHPDTRAPARVQTRSRKAPV